MSDLVKVTISSDPLFITVADHTSPTVEIRTEPVIVNIDTALTPNVNVYTGGGGRSGVWLPGQVYDPTNIVAILTGAISKQQLATDLADVIDETEAGLVDVRNDLTDVINTGITTGTFVDTVLTPRVAITENTIGLHAARLDGVEEDIETARISVEAKEIRLSVAEGSILEHDNYIVTQENILKNEWTVKIQENTDGSAYAAGVGLLVYPAWALAKVYDLGEYVWFNDHAYKAEIAHTSDANNAPGNTSYWAYQPYATKSAFGVLADTFFIQTQVSGQKITPFIVQGNDVMVDGDLIVNGLVASNVVWAWNIQSQNYVAGVSGYSINAWTGQAEFNQFTLTVSYNDLTDKPTLTDLGYTGALDADKTSTVDVAAQINSNTTTIHGGKITTGTINALGSVTVGAFNINDKFIMDTSGNTTIQSATSGERTVILNNVIKVYDASGVLRVKLGDLSA